MWSGESIGYDLGTILLGRVVWIELDGGDAACTVVAAWRDDFYGCQFLVESEDGRLLEVNYGEISTVKPED